jgi:prepilin-type processing-associated H-X9-DG protein
LIELLVCIAMIAILAAMLLPVLGSARVKGQAAACLNSHRQLMLACLMYAEDSRDTMPYNLGESEIRRTQADQRFLNWNSSVMSWELDSDNTNVTLVTTGGIGPYTGGSAAIYRCPADRAVSEVQADAGWTARVRTISMNAMVGDAGEFSNAGANVNNPNYKQFFRLSQIPKPNMIFVFMEEHPDSINDGYFLNKHRSMQWLDLPASFHNGAANLTFADGHAESHTWLSSSTRPPARPDAANLPFEIPPQERVDYDWLMARTSIYFSTAK